MGDGPLSTAKSAYIFILARNLAVIRRFYHEVLGFKIIHEVEGLCAFFSPHEGFSPHLAVYTGKTSERTSEEHCFVVFDVEDVSKTVHELQIRGVTVSEIFPVPYGCAAKFFDPEGNVFEIHQSFIQTECNR